MILTRLAIIKTKSIWSTLQCKTNSRIFIFFPDFQRSHPKKASPPPPPWPLQRMTFLCMVPCSHRNERKSLQSRIALWQNSNVQIQFRSHLMILGLCSFHRQDINHRFNPWTCPCPRRDTNHLSNLKSCLCLRRDTSLRLSPWALPCFRYSCQLSMRISECLSRGINLRSFLKTCQYRNPGTTRQSSLLSVFRGQSSTPISPKQSLLNLKRSANKTLPRRWQTTLMPSKITSQLLEALNLKLRTLPRLKLKPKLVMIRNRKKPSLVIQRHLIVIKLRRWHHRQSRKKSGRLSTLSPRSKPAPRT